MRQSPLSQSQLGIYLGSAYREDLAYHIAYAFRFPADTDVSRLEAALKKVMACHPALNVAIVTDENGEAMMEWDGGTLPEIPFKSMTDAEFEDLKRHLIKHIDVPGEGMCRFEIVRAESAVWLTMLVHHIIYDGSSMRVFLRDLDIAMKGGDPERRLSPALISQNGSWRRVPAPNMRLRRNIIPRLSVISTPTGPPSIRMPRESLDSAIRCSASLLRYRNSRVARRLPTPLWA